MTLDKLVRRVALPGVFVLGACGPATYGPGDGFGDPIGSDSGTPGAEGARYLHDSIGVASFDFGPKPLSRDASVGVAAYASQSPHDFDYLADAASFDVGTGNLRIFESGILNEGIDDTSWTLHSRGGYNPNGGVDTPCPSSDLTVGEATQEIVDNYNHAVFTNDDYDGNLLLVFSNNPYNGMDGSANFPFSLTNPDLCGFDIRR